MNTKKSIAAAVVAVGLTFSIAGAPAQSETSGDSAVAKAEQRVAVAHEALQAAQVDNARTGDTARKCKSKAASMKETKKIRPYMKYTKAKKILGSKGRKVGSKTLRAWNTCYDLSDLYLTMFKHKGTLLVYSIDAPILG